MPTILVQRTLVDYAEAGAGDDPIIMIHGGFGSSANLWTRTAAALPAGFRAVMPNLFIRSGRPENGWNVVSFADHVRAFADALELPAFTVMGHSMGGLVSQLVAIRHPERVRRVVLVATGPNIRNHGIAESVYRQLEQGGATRENLEAISRHWFHEIPDQALFDAYVDDAMDAPLEAMLEAQRSLLATDVEPDLHRIAAPTLVLHGALDHGRTMDHADRLQRNIPDCSVVVFRKSGHAPMWEEPAAFDAALHDFLRRR